MISKLDEFRYDAFSEDAGWKSGEKEEPKVETSNGLDYFFLGQEAIKILRFAINHQFQFMDEPIERARTMEELSELTNKSYLMKKAEENEKKKN
jgi:hypothetical protein